MESKRKEDFKGRIVASSVLGGGQLEEGEAEMLVMSSEAGDE